MPAARVESLSAFGEKSAPPTDAGLMAMIGPAAAAWKAACAHVSERYGPVSAEWNFAGARYGWSMRLRKRDRVVLYLIPQRSSFLAGIVLGDQAVAAAREAGLPAAVLEEIAAARRYAEGTGFRLRVTGVDDLQPIETLVRLKMAR